MKFNYDVIVVGAGHAGCEAACSAANLGSETLLITMDMNKIAQMSCNPAIGGIAKGQIVREIDALGGFTGIVTDQTAIQFRMLNRSKGPAMWSPRVQSDRAKFIETWRRIIENTEHLSIWQDTVNKLIIKEHTITGVITGMGVTFTARSVVITSGTFMNGLMHIGKTQLPGGRISEPASYGISEQLKEEGIIVGRMKTGTPVRIDGRSIDFNLLTEQTGENDFHKFSYLNFEPRKLKQQSCWITYTNEEVHKILKEGLPDSPLFNGQIKSIGPRYCPSIETKIVTFPDKTEHQLFLEPEGETTHEFYLNGFSSSLPLNVQLNALQKIPAFRNIQIYRPGYAIEYDYFDPTQLKHTLETKAINGLFFAGQVNGTTGYEEAAGQGLIAGINAHLKCHGNNEFILGRNEAYIGVLIDDLVTKGVDEPYRMFTSRSEYRLYLRADNADLRLTEKGYQIGCVSQDRYAVFKSKKEQLDKYRNIVQQTYISVAAIDKYNLPIKKDGNKKSVFDLLGYNDVSRETIMKIMPEIKNVQDNVFEQLCIEAKYSGYMKRQSSDIETFKKDEAVKIKSDIDYRKIGGLSREVVAKLEKVHPSTIGEASRISGVTPAAVIAILGYMKK